MDKRVLLIGVQKSFMINAIAIGLQKDNYEVIAEYTTIKVKSGFFDKIIAFFKGLLGLLPSDEIKP